MQDNHPVEQGTTTGGPRAKTGPPAIFSGPPDYFGSPKCCTKLFHYLRKAVVARRFLCETPIGNHAARDYILKYNCVHTVSHKKIAPAASSYTLDHFVSIRASKDGSGQHSGVLWTERAVWLTIAHSRHLLTAYPHFILTTCTPSSQELFGNHCQSTTFFFCKDVWNSSAENSLLHLSVGQYGFRLCCLEIWVIGFVLFNLC